MARGKDKGTATNNGAGSKYHFVGGSKGKEIAWAEISPEIVGEAVIAVLAGGDAIMCSTTSDGGAMRVTLFEGPDRRHEYLTTPAEIDELMRAISQATD